MKTSYLFLIPLLLGFALNSASNFTAFYSRHWGEKRGKMITFFLRNVFGIPLWAVGIILAVWLPSPMLFYSGIESVILGWLLVTGGAVLIFAALRIIGKCAAYPSPEDTLIDTDLYAVIRHPIYSGLLLELIGILLLKSSLAALIACSLGVIWILIQARLEEKDLLQRIPAYREYMQRVPRFFPRIKR